MITSSGLDNVGSVQKDPKLPTTLFLRRVQQCLLFLKLNISLRSLAIGRRQNFSLLFVAFFCFAFLSLFLFFLLPRNYKALFWWEKICTKIPRIVKLFSKRKYRWEVEQHSYWSFCVNLLIAFFLCRVFGVEIIHSCSIFSATSQE